MIVEVDGRVFDTDKVEIKLQGGQQIEVTPDGILFDDGAVETYQPHEISFDG